MKRSEKIRLIKGLIRGTADLEELKSPEVEVWIQESGKDIYNNFKTGEVCKKAELLKRKNSITKIIRMDYVKGKTIL